MKPAAIIQTTIEVLKAIETEQKPADSVINNFFRNRRYIGSKDRTAVAEAVYNIIRHFARLHWWLNRFDTEASARHLVISDIMLGATAPECQSKPSSLRATTESEAIQKPAYGLLRFARNDDHMQNISLLFSGGKFAPAVLDEGEKRLVRALVGRTLEHPEMPEAVAVECPEWAESSLRKIFGDRFNAEMSAMMESATIDLRVNTVKTTREEALAELARNKVRAMATPWSPVGIRVSGRPSLSTMDIFKNGFIEIQDEGSQLAALLVDAKPGHMVADLCAGAGGKTLAIAAEMQNKGRITACDVLGNRLKRAALRFRRAGLHNIDTRPLTSLSDQWIKRHKGAFDRVLADVPCTGVGTWRRNPDARWRRLGPSMEELLRLQTEILQTAAKLVKPGGRLIYATCSMLEEEDEKQIETFLASDVGRDFTLLPLCDLWPELSLRLFPGVPSPQFLRLSPAQHDTDGFFAAVLEHTAIG